MQVWGGIVTKEIKKSNYDIFIPLLKIAKSNNCKVHGLGFTSTKLLNKYHFYSVDSSSWSSGRRFANYPYYSNGVIRTKSMAEKGKRMTNYDDLDPYCVREWLKFQKYAKKYL